MADNNFNDYPVKFLLAGLFLICMVSFGVGLANNYGYNDSLMKSDKIDFTALENQINKTSSDAEGWSKAFKSDNLFVSAGSIVLFSVWGIAKLIWDSTMSLFKVIIDGAVNILGIPPIAVGVLTAVILISIIFAVWKMIKAGE